MLANILASRFFESLRGKSRKKITRLSRQKRRSLLLESLENRKVMAVAVGDIAFTAFQSDNTLGAGGDAFEFVAINPIASGETIYFTDNGYKSDASQVFRTNENTVRWVAQSNIAAGTKISFVDPGGSGGPNSPEWTGINDETGANAANTAFGLSTSGDSVIAIVNPTFGGADLLNGTAIAAFTASGSFTANFDGSNTNNTGLPPGLTVGVNAVAVANQDNAVYDPNVAGSVESGSAAAVRTSVNTAANWATSETVIGNGFTTATFTIASGPEANVLGNALSIADGDTTPDVADHTSFPSTVIGNSNTRTFTIQNTGTSNLTFSGLSSSNPGIFAISGSPVSPIAPGNSVTFDVIFTPTVAGLATSTISFANNDSDENPYNFDVNGNATAAPAPEVNVLGNLVSIVDGDTTPSLTDHTGFVTTPVGSSSTRTYTIQNVGTANLTFSGLASSNPGVFAISGAPVSPIAPGNSVTFNVIFTPAAAGLATSTISFTNNDSDENPYNFDVSGSGVVLPNVKLNESRNSHNTLDDVSNNFAEIYATGGASGVSLSGLTLLVISGEFAPGQIDFAVDLSTAVSDANGFVLVADNGTTATTDPGDIVLTDFDLFGSPHTILLVSGFTGAVGNDVDTDNVGNNFNAVVPWTSIVDSVSADKMAGTSQNYSPTVVLSSDGFQPAGIRRIANGTGAWGTMPFTSNALDTPGFTNVFAPGVTVTPTLNSTMVTEGGATDTFSVNLNSEPTSNVTVTFTITDGETTVSSGSLTFTNSLGANPWNVPQVVTVTAVNDLDVEGLHSGSIGVTVSSADAAYNNLVVPAVSVSVVDNEGPALTQLLINELTFDLPGTDTGNEYLEFRGTPGALIPSDYYLVQLEGDSGGGNGAVDQVFSLGGMAPGPNGFLVLLQAGNTYTTNPSSTVVTATGTGWGTTFSNQSNDIENESTSFLLIRSAVAPVPGSDVDSTNTGVLSGAATSWTIVDSIGILDGDVTDTGYAALNYSADADGLVAGGNVKFSLFGFDLINGDGFTPDYVGRNGNTTGQTSADWVASDLLGAAPNYTVDQNEAAPAATSGSLNHLGATNVFAVGPEINVTGATFNIFDGDVIPSLSDGTDFGGVAIGSPLAKQFVIQSQSGIALDVSAITITGADAASFSISGIVLPANIPGGNTATFTVTFNPASAGTKNAMVEIANTDSNENPYNFAITGTATNGLVPEINVESNFLTIPDGDVTPSLTDNTDFGSVDVAVGLGGETFFIENNGTANLNVTAISFSGPNAADFALVPGSITLPAVVTPNMFVSFRVSFNPSAAGARNATVEIANTDSDENPYNYAITGNGVNATGASILINEVDADNVGDDSVEFVELFGPAGTSLDGLVLVLFNGGVANDTSYDAIDLDGQTIPANGYLVIGSAGVTNVDLDAFTTDGIQNGADAVALFTGDAGGFPNGTVPTITNLRDAVVYDTSDADDAALLAALGETTQFDENANGLGTTQSNSRVPNGLNASPFVAQTPTPGLANILDTTPPTITNVIVAGSTWTTFIDAVDGGGVGTGNGLGHALPGANQLRNLPWTNMNRIYIQFSEDVGSFTAANMTLTGVNTASYAGLFTVAYNAGLARATISMNNSLTVDKLLIKIPSGSVADLAGNSLDGEWTDSVSTVSGNGTAGGQFAFRIDVLPGDSTNNNTVNAQDVGQINGRSFTSPGVGNYDPFFDVNGTASINAADVGQANARSFTSLPGGEPMRPGSLLAPPIEIDGRGKERDEDPEASWAIAVDTVLDDLTEDLA